MKKTIIILAAFLGLVVLAFATNSLGKKEIVIPIQKQIKIGDVMLSVEIADTEAKREQGLSGKAGLLENEGMLFIFENPGYYGFWMKDMNFPIDMAWLDKNKKIVHIESNVSPATYPKVFNSSEPSLYVLETSAGFLGKNNIKIGDFFAF